MKRLIVILLGTLLLLAALPAWAEQGPNYEEMRIIMLDAIYDPDELAPSEEKWQKITSNTSSVGNLSEAMMSLTSGRADAFYSTYESLRYMASQNEGFVAVPFNEQYSLHIVAKETNGEMITGINAALKTLIEDGSMEMLWQSHIEDVIAGEEPAVSQPPAEEGARIYKIGVSGDMPPMDYTAADGAPAGYNTALLSMLSDHMGVSFELVVIESGARYAALTAGTIDGFFWHERMIIPEEWMDQAERERMRSVMDAGVHLSVDEVCEEQNHYLISDAYCTLAMGVLVKGGE